MHQEFSGAMEKSECGTNAETVKNELTGILTSYGHVQGYGEQAVKAYCLASSKKEKDKASSEEKYCTSLYYWIGNELFSTMTDSTQFATAMKDVYNKLEQLKGLQINDKCKVMYENDNITWDIFNHMKALYEYRQDYNTIYATATADATTQVDCAGRPKTGKCHCKYDYSSYLTTTVDAYNQMRQHCGDRGGSGTHSDKAWCTEFNRWFHQQREDVSPSSNSILSPSQLKCKLKYTSDCTNITIPAAAIFGTLTSIGIPTIAYAFYKYGLLTSWFGNHTFGNSNSGGRSRRSARSNFDTLRDSSTEYSANYSSVASRAASTTTDSTDGASTIYDREFIIQIKKLNIYRWVICTMGKE
ncbi:KIR-like protein [Plasmodium coatneyi]|uniref:KIR-like protein n=1 Tax=Plasmodium coatneyi TaxID=208452 RepID=A0A1B1E5T1_9APIC|nr:KIR-like protein [Plasmodium coatneyi]ANQ10394.1 KIR-like protein [Plasmodium coatneyi]